MANIFVMSFYRAVYITEMESVQSQNHKNKLQGNIFTLHSLTMLGLAQSQDKQWCRKNI